MGGTIAQSVKIYTRPGLRQPRSLRKSAFRIPIGRFLGSLEQNRWPTLPAHLRLAEQTIRSPHRVWATCGAVLPARDLLGLGHHRLALAVRFFQEGHRNPLRGRAGHDLSGLHIELRSVSVKRSAANTERDRERHQHWKYGVSLELRPAAHARAP